MSDVLVSKLKPPIVAWRRVILMAIPPDEAKPMELQVWMFVI
jgi:hypothetical protein